MCIYIRIIPFYLEHTANKFLLSNKICWNGFMQIYDSTNRIIIYIAIIIGIVNTGLYVF